MLRRAMNLRVIATALVVAGGLGLAGALPVQGQAQSGGRVCGFLHARVPYSTRAGGPVWRVYARGHASCRAATGVLDAVMHLRGADHDNGAQSNSYVTYRGWTCPYGQMGSQLCFLGPTGHPRAQALADRCSEAACPSNRVPAF